MSGGPSFFLSEGVFGRLRLRVSDIDNFLNPTAGTAGLLGRCLGFPDVLGLLEGRGRGDSDGWEPALDGLTVDLLIVDERRGEVDPAASSSSCPSLPASAGVLLPLPPKMDSLWNMDCLGATG